MFFNKWCGPSEGCLGTYVKITEGTPTVWGTEVNFWFGKIWFSCCLNFDACKRRLAQMKDSLQIYLENWGGWGLEIWPEITARMLKVDSRKTTITILTGLCLLLFEFYRCLFVYSWSLLQWLSKNSMIAWSKQSEDKYCYTGCQKILKTLFDVVRSKQSLEWPPKFKR